jgi:hypothetical protein
MTIAISVAALAVSITTLLLSRRRDRRDLLLRMHEHLTTADQQRARRLLYLMSESGRRVEDLSEQEHALINNALASLNTLGIYYQRRYVRRKDLLEIWAETVLRLLNPAGAFLTYRNALPGGSKWPQLHLLADDARKYLRQQGIDPDAVTAIREGRSSQVELP